MSLTLQSMGQTKGEYTADCGDLPGIKNWSLNHIWLWAGILNKLMHSILFYIVLFLLKRTQKAILSQPLAIARHLAMHSCNALFHLCESRLGLWKLSIFVPLCSLDATLTFAYLLQNHYHASKFLVQKRSLEEGVLDNIETELKFWSNKMDRPWLTL